MGIKESGLQFATDIENAIIDTRADMMQGLEDLTHRINGIGNDLKSFRTEVTKELTVIKGDVQELKAGQAAAMEILIDLQRRMSAA
ncbi:hypothetical protein ACFXJ8_28230 [Nonomuraea sp. NPDC059194]|uniref:hypothetical protein n=1 Tax=Nonomuraea sp. NPDC059194 TaxID=3346764 RepID=UPI0036A795E9